VKQLIMKPGKHRYNLLKTLLLLPALLIAVAGYCQEKDFRYYDSVTYRYYTDKDWKSLIAAGNEALQKGFSYNYLDVRLAIANYEMRNYRKAAPLFEKALRDFSTDPFTAEYLYYAYLESGRGKDAAMLAGNYKNKFVMIPGTNNKLLNMAYAEGGYLPDGSPNLSTAALIGADSIYGEADVFGSQSYLHFGIQLQPTPSMQLYLSAGTLGISKQQRFAYSLYDAEFARRIITDTTFNYNFRQNEFYTSLSVTPVAGFTLTPAFHYMGGRPSPVSCTFSDLMYRFGNGSYSYNHYVVSVGLTGEAGNFSLGMGGSYAKLTTTGNQLQVNGTISWFPFGNLDLYTTTTLTGFKDGADRRLIFDEAAGGKLASRFWIEGMITLGDLSFYNEKNAFIVYNLPERIVFRSGANLVYTLNSHLDISMMYRFYKREYDFTTYSYDAVNSLYVPQISTTHYNNHGIYGGLKWKF
ncbi:MAG TPA: tetratricopeptide repeat protein, partial [Bacteroidales bacterium]|nr:tetratricopeptide repeat protein [Bacteroidales bacterium]